MDCDCLLRPIRAAFNRLPPFAPFVATGPTRRIPTPDLPDRQAEAPQSTLPRAIKRKRTPKEDPVEQFIEWLIEAVDRNVARESIEEQLKKIDEWNAHDHKEIEELTCRVEFLEPMASNEAALTRVLDQRKKYIADYRAEIKSNAEQEDFLKRGLTHVNRELAALFRVIYNSSDAFLKAADINGTLRDFHDGRGNLKRDVVLSKTLASNLRMAADCSRLLSSNRKRIDKVHREWTNACASARASSQRSRWTKRKMESFKVWHREEKAYALQSKAQEERERKLLKDLVQKFLVSNELVFEERRLSEASSDEDIVRTRDDPEPQPQPALANPHPRDPRAEVHNWMVLRGDLARVRKGLETDRKHYDEGLANHLYAYPQSTKVDFDAMYREQHGFNPEENQRTLMSTLQQVETQYRAARDAAKAAGIVDLPMSPEWAGSAHDVAASDASSLGFEDRPARLAKSRREVRRWHRTVARLQPVGPDGLPGGRLKRREHSPQEFEKLPSPGLDDCDVGPLSITLSPNGVQRRLRSINDNREYFRDQFQALTEVKYA